MSVVVTFHGSVDDPVEIRADDAVLGRRRRQPLEASELAERSLRDLLRQLERLEPLAQLGDLRLLRVGLAELLLDRLQLLAQEELALPLVELGLHLRLDLRAELEHLELAVQDQRDLAQPRFDVDELEQRLLLLGLQPQRRRDEVAERARVVDVGGRDLQLLRQVRDEADDAREEPLHVARQRLDLLRLREHVRQLGELADEVRLVLHAPLEAHAADPLDEHRAASRRERESSCARRPPSRLVEVVPAGRVGRRRS